MGPVAIFDSGVGGMSLFLALRDKAPSLPLTYLADTAHFPYGNKSPKEILQYSEDICQFFIKKGAQAILFGCNTASSAALPILQKKLSLPLIGVIEPAVEHILSFQKVERLGIIGTKTTIELGLHKKLLQEKKPSLNVFGQSCPELASLVELGASQKEKRALLKEYLQPLIEKQIDSLLLACTHYTFVVSDIKALLPKECHIFDTTEACIDSFLQQHPSLLQQQGDGSSQILTTGRSDLFKKTLKKCCEQVQF